MLYTFILESTSILYNVCCMVAYVCICNYGCFMLMSEFGLRAAVLPSKLLKKGNLISMSYVPGKRKGLQNR